MKVAISGAGIAGLTAAYWFRHYGHEVEILGPSKIIYSHNYNY